MASETSCAKQPQQRRPATNGRTSVIGTLFAFVLAACASDGLSSGFTASSPPVVKEPTPRLFKPKWATHTLDNGIQVFVNADPALPTAFVSLALRGGLLAEPVAQAGISELMLEAMWARSERLNRAGIGGAFDDTAQLAGAAYEDGLLINADVLVDRLGPFFQVAAEVLLKPAFVENDNVAFARERLLALIAAEHSDPEDLAERSLARIIYGEGHRLSISDYGSKKTLSGITGADLEQWYAQAFQPDQMAIAVAGRVDTQAVVALLAQHFGGWKPAKQATKTPKRAKAARSTRHPNAPDAAQSFPDPKSVESRTVVYGIKRPGLPQTVIRMGRVGLPRAHPDRAVLSWLIGSVSAGASQFLRAYDGVTYGVSSRYQSSQHTGHFFLGTEVQSDATQKAVSTLLRAFDSANNASGFSNATLAYITTQILFAENQADFRLRGRAVGRARRWMLNLSEFFVGTLDEHLSTLRTADYELVGDRFLKPGEQQIVLVGEPAGIQAVADEMSFTTVKWLE